ncbi:MAG: DUF3825 domain-containing protein [Bacteroidota bacterium]
MDNQQVTSLFRALGEPVEFLDIALVGGHAKRLGIDYQALGFQKLGEFFRAYPQHFSWRYDETVSPPRFLVRFNLGGDLPEDYDTQIRPPVAYERRPNIPYRPRTDDGGFNRAPGYNHDGRPDSPYMQQGQQPGYYNPQAYNNNPNQANDRRPYEPRQYNRRPDNGGPWESRTFAPDGTLINTPARQTDGYRQTQQGQSAGNHNQLPGNDHEQEHEPDNFNYGHAGSEQEDHAAHGYAPEEGAENLGEHNADDIFDGPARIAGDDEQYEDGAQYLDAQGNADPSAQHNPQGQQIDGHEQNRPFTRYEGRQTGPYPPRPYTRPVHGADGLAGGENNPYPAPYNDGRNDGRGFNRTEGRTDGMPFGNSQSQDNRPYNRFDPRPYTNNFGQRRSDGYPQDNRQNNQYPQGDYRQGNYRPDGYSRERIDGHDKRQPFQNQPSSYQQDGRQHDGRPFDGQRFDGRPSGPENRYNHRDGTDGVEYRGGYRAPQTTHDFFSQDYPPIPFAGKTLFSWAFWPDFDAIVQSLREMCLPESWSFGDAEPGCRILKNYLNYTLYKHTRDGSVAVGERFAAWNTGLVNRDYNFIYCIFYKNPGTRSRFSYKFADFCIAGEGQFGKELMREFHPLPQRINYFKGHNELVYNYMQGFPIVDIDHIILERTSRLPAALLTEYFADRDYTQVSAMPSEERKAFFMEIGQALRQDAVAFSKIKSRLEYAIATAVKKAAFDYKAAIPMYYPPFNILSFLLPLAIVNPDVVDCALVVEKTRSGAYQGHTILPLDMAYLNARLISRPDCGWLLLNEIAGNTPGEVYEQ